MKLLIAIMTLLLPWPMKRVFLIWLCGYEIHAKAKMGLCLVFPQKLILEEGAQIGHLTVCKDLELVHIKMHSIVGRGNWITGLPLGNKAYAHQEDRLSAFIIGEHSVVTHRHIIMCNASVRIGHHTSVGGFRSTFLTHAIDIEKNRQHSEPISIGNYCIVGTNCVLLPGCELPDYCILGASSMLNKKLDEKHTAYGGVPARAIKKLNPCSKYFNRVEGYVV